MKNEDQNLKRLLIAASRVDMLPDMAERGENETLFWPPLTEDVNDPISVYLAAPKHPLPLDRGLRHNTGKLPLRLLPWDALEEVAKVLQFGAQLKPNARGPGLHGYGDYNWAKGLSREECLDSILRHFSALSQGAELDAESGISHVAHIACNALFILALEKRGKLLP